MDNSNLKNDFWKLQSVWLKMTNVHLSLKIGDVECYNTYIWIQFLLKKILICILGHYFFVQSKNLQVIYFKWLNLKL